MNKQILEALDEEIARLHQVRAILSGANIMSGRKKKPAMAEAVEKPRRTLSTKARRAIAEAQRRRWERVRSTKKEAAPVTPPAKKEPAAG